MSIKEIFFYRQIWTVTAIAVMLGFVGMFALNLKHGYEEKLERAAADSRNLALVLEQHAAATIQKIDIAMQHIVEMTASIPGADAHAHAGELGEYLRSILKTLPELRELQVVKADGYTLADGRSAVPKAYRLYRGDAPHFIRHRDNPDLGLDISEPVRGRANSGWNVILSRRVNNPDGSFAGIVDAAIGLSYFDDFYSSFDQGKNGALVLLSDKRILLARFPILENWRGKALHNSPLDAQLSKNPHGGTYSGKSKVDGVERIFSYRQVGEWPLVVVAALGKQDVLAEWRRNTLINSSVMAALLAAIVFLGHGMLRRYERETEMVEQLRTTSIQLNDANEELKILNETLEQRVTEEVGRNMEQERLLIQQSRLAAMGEMIGNIAHQWRQPINALNLLLANIKDAYEYNELDKEYLDREVDKGQQMIQKMSCTIDDFRNFFKPNKEKTAFSLKKSVEDTLDILSASFKNSSIVVHLDADEDVIAHGFPNEYSQVLLNILNNAKDAMKAKKITNGEIHIRIARHGNQAGVSVRDNGGGIPADILPKIFDPYFTTKEKGTGIGLYMSKMIVEDSMGGTIEARNVEGGAEFTVICPVA